MHTFILGLLIESRDRSKFGQPIGTYFEQPDTLQILMEAYKIQSLAFHFLNVSKEVHALWHLHRIRIKLAFSRKFALLPASTHSQGKDTLLVSKTGRTGSSFGSAMLWLGYKAFRASAISL